MTKEEKRFKIIKKEEYEKQKSSEENNTIFTTVVLGLASIAAVIMFLAFSKETTLEGKIIESILGLSCVGANIYLLKNLIESVSRKTMLESKIEDINNELEISNRIEEQKEISEILLTK